MTITREQLEEKYKGLPQDVKDVVFSADVEDEVEQIGKKYELHIDQMGELMEEVELVMLGITHYSNFIPNIRERLGISDKEKIRNIADEVNEKLFRKIRESLRKIHGDEDKAPIDKKPQAVGTDYKSGVNDKNQSGEKATEEKDLMEDKLGGVHSTPKEESSYEMEEKDTPKAVDPYREPID